MDTFATRMLNILIESESNYSNKQVNLSGRILNGVMDFSLINQSGFQLKNIQN